MLSLFTLAANDALIDADAIATQARAMLQDPRAEDVVSRFHREWLQIDSVGDGLTKDGAVYPDFTPVLAASMAQEADRFFRSLFRDHGTFTTVMSGRTRELNAPLAVLYGVDSASSSESEWKAVALPPERAGVLSMPAFLSAHGHRGDTSPVKRGVFVLRRVMCRRMDAPPANIEPAPDRGVLGNTWRDRLVDHVAPSCAKCHKAIEPPGLALETFDGIGRWRTTDRGDVIDPAGTFDEWGDISGSFRDAAGMIAKLAASSTARDCYATQWFQYAQGRPSARPQDGCSVQALERSFARSGGDIRDLIVALTQTDAFRYRRAPEGVNP